MRAIRLDVSVVAACAVVLFVSPRVTAQDSEAKLAVGGNDPVALCGGAAVEGRADLTATFGRYVYRFADEKSRARFVGDPGRWAIQWGGGCASMGPLSGRGDPGRWTVHRGRLYIFASDGCRKSFLRDPERFVPVPGKEQAKKVKATKDALRKGTDWVERSVAAHGGAAALGRSKALVFEGSSESRGWRNDRSLVVTSELGVQRRSVWVPPKKGEGGFETVWVVMEDAFTEENGVRHSMVSPEEREDVRRFALREPVALLWARKKAGFQAVHRGRGKLGELAVEDVDVRVEGLWTRLHLDPESGRMLGISWRGRAGGGVTSDVTEEFVKWRVVEGVETVTERSVTVGGKVDRGLGRPWKTIRLVDSVEVGGVKKSKR